MSTTTVRVRPETRDKLRELSEQSGRHIAEVLEEAVEQLRRRRFMEEVNQSFTQLRADPEAWAEELAERRETEGTLMDGLEDDPYVEQP